jgi:hypothetical protein
VANLRIALVFGVGLEYVFAGAREKPLVAVTRKRQRVELPEPRACARRRIGFASLDYAVTERRFIAITRSSCRSRARSYGRMIIRVSSSSRGDPGTLSVHINGEEHARGTGVLTNISLYWFTNTAASSVRLYYESARTPLAFDRSTRVGIPTAVLRCPLEAPFPPRSSIERGYRVMPWTDSAWRPLCRA